MKDKIKNLSKIMYQKEKDIVTRLEKMYNESASLKRGLMDRWEQ
ncbi:MAG: hypothetical protein ACRCSD_09785 [Clostridium sp.]